MSGRERIDKLLLDLGLETSRDRARARILAGQVRVDGHAVTKAGTQVRRDAKVELVGEALPYVSRGGLKLAQALDAFAVDPAGAVCMDVGASTGGFTDCLLQRGAARVYAIDVGYGQLAWSLRQDERVVSLERTNIRKMDPSLVPEPVRVVVIDCSFIGLDRVLPHVVPFLGPEATVVALVKPQFEAGREGVGKGGVVRDPEVREAAIERVRASARALGFVVRGGVDCDTHGPAGNVEYLLRLDWTGSVPEPPLP